MISLNSSFGQIINPSLSAGPLPILAPQIFSSTPLTHEPWLSTFNSSSSNLFSDLDALNADTSPLGLKDKHLSGLTSRRSARRRMKSKPRPSRINRRSLNTFSHTNPRVARLMGKPTGRHGGAGGQGRLTQGGHVALEVSPTGAVSTTLNLSSIYSVLKVLCLCCIAPHSFRPCPLPNEDTLDEDGHSIYASVLLHYNETNRFLCINSSGKVYSRLKDEDNDTLRDCVFIHSVHTSDGYDVYRSKSYPKIKPRCQQHGQSNNPYCRSAWYLAINKRGQVRVIRQNASVNPPWRTFFLRKWVYNSAASPSWQPQELSESDLQKESSKPSKSSTNQRKEKIFKILPTKSELRGRFSNRRRKEKKTSNKNCNNLLSSKCGSSSFSNKDESSRPKQESSGKTKKKSSSLHTLLSLKDTVRRPFLISRTDDTLRHDVITGADFINGIGRQIALHTRDQRETSSHWQRLSFALQRFNAVCFRGSFNLADLE